MLVNYRYRKFELLNYHQNYHYRKMHKIWAQKYTQEKQDHSLPFEYANLFWFRANILVQSQWYCILLTQLCRNFFFFFNLFCIFDPNFWLFGRNYRKDYRKLIYRNFSKYLQNYRYQYKISKFIGDLKELLAKLLISKLTKFLKKSSISKKITYCPPLGVGVGHVL